MFESCGFVCPEMGLLFLSHWCVKPAPVFEFIETEFPLQKVTCPSALAVAVKPVPVPISMAADVSVQVPFTYFRR